MSTQVEISTRDAKWDNVKGLLILAVVIGHVIMGYTGAEKDADIMYMLIWTFHMPLFIFVSGMFAKKAVDQKNYGKAFFFLGLFLTIKIIQFIVRALVYKDYTFNLFVEESVPWYAFAMFVFYLVTMQLSKLSPKYILGIAVIFALIIGYDSNIGAYLVLSRIIVFYPFFYLGYLVQNQSFEKLVHKRWIRIGSLIGIVVFAFVVIKWIDLYYNLRPFMTGQNSYYVSKLDGSIELFGRDYKISTLGPIFRMVSYAITSAVGFFIIAIAPEKKCLLTWLGRNTLQIYVLHINFIYILFGWFGMESIMKSIWPEHFVLVGILVGIMITLISAIPIFTKALNPILYPKYRNSEEKK